MSQYDITDAHKLKVFMQEIQTIVDKYPKGAGIYIEDCPTHIKEAIEFIGNMVKRQES